MAICDYNEHMSGVDHVDQAKWKYKVVMFYLPWDSRAPDENWIKKGWPPRDSIKVGKANVMNKPLTSREKNYYSNITCQT